MWFFNWLGSVFYLKRIETKILLLVFGTCGTILLVTGLSFCQYEAYQTNKNQAQDVAHIVHVLTPSLYKALEHKESRTINKILSSLRYLPIIDHVILLDENEQVWVNQSDLMLDAKTVNLGMLEEHYSDHYTYTYRLQAQPDQYATLYVIANQDQIRQEVGRFQLMLLIEMLILLVGGYVCAYWFTGQILKPIEQLTKAAKEIQADGTLKQPVHNPYHDEFGTMIHAFNTMMLRVTQIQGYLDDIVDSMPSCIIGLSPSWDIIAWNKVAKRWSGLDRSQVSEQQLMQVLPMLNQQLAFIQQTIHQQVMTKLPPWREGQDYYEGVIYPLSQVAGCVIRLDKITSRVKVEQTLIQHEKMMSVGGLAAGMAHELNNPLGGILQQVQNIERRLLVSIPANHAAADAMSITFEQVSDYCQKREIPKLIKGVKELGARASDIIHRMLQFAKPPSTEKKLISPQALIEQTLHLLAHDPLMATTIVSEQFDENLPEVACIPGEITQVLLNICQNALYAMQSSDKRVLTFHAGVEEDYLVIKISDTGIGLDEVATKKIFEPFYTTKPEGKGTGLGLSVSYFIINTRHQGDIYVESLVDEGSSFFVHLPLSVPTV